MSARDELAELRKKAYQSTVIAKDLRERAAREDERSAEYRKQLGQGAGSECEELAAKLNDAIEPFYEPFDWHEATSMASTLLAAGYRKPRTITALQELDALGNGSAILDASGVAWINDGDSADEWGSISEDYGGGPIWASGVDIKLPATVLHEPEADR